MSLPLPQDIFRVDLDVSGTGSYNYSLKPYITAITWRLGMTKAYDNVAPAGSAEIHLTNYDGTFSPERNTLLIPGRRIRIAYMDNIFLRVLFVGYIVEVVPDSGIYGSRTAIVRLTTPETELESVPVTLSAQINRRANEILASVFARTPLNRFSRTFQTGISRLAYVGDTWSDGIPAMQAIQEVVEAERGRFFYNRNGQLTFLNRHATFTPQALKGTFDETMDGIKYVYGGDIVNRVRVQIRPRQLGTPGTVLWRLQNNQVIRPGIAGQREIIARLRDVNNNPIGATTVIIPVPTTDFTANTLPDGNGADMTGQLVVTVVAIEGSAVRLRIRNNHTNAVYLRAGTQFRGTPLYVGDTLTVEQSDSASLNVYGVRPLDLALPALDAIEDADQLARFELSRRKDAYGIVTRLTLITQENFPLVLNIGLFDQIQVTEAHTGHNSRYIVVGETHTFKGGGTRLESTWTLEPFNTPPYWALNSTPLGADTRVAY